MTEYKLVVVGGRDLDTYNLAWSFVYERSLYFTPSVFETFSYELNIDSNSVKVAIWTTCPAADYERLRVLSYPHADIFLLIFSVISPQTFEDIKTKWIPEVTHHCPHVLYLLVGIETDLREDKPTIEKLAKKNLTPITFERGMQLAKEIGAVNYLECSAETQQGIKKLFEYVARFCYETSKNPLLLIPSKKNKRKKYSDFPKFQNFPLEFPSENDIKIKVSDLWKSLDQNQPSILTEFQHTFHELEEKSLQQLSKQRDEQGRDLLMLCCHLGWIQETRKLLSSCPELEINQQFKLKGSLMKGRIFNSNPSVSHKTAYEYALQSEQRVELLQVFQEFEQKLDEEQLKLAEISMKVIVVGEAAAGKTTLCTRLKQVHQNSKDQFPHHQLNQATNGIEISELPHSTKKDDQDSAAPTLRIFDFGGQEILYPTHQLFLTEESIFILVINLASYDWNTTEYWCEKISLYSHNLPLFVVGTHCDEMKNFKSELESIKLKIKEQFPVIKFSQSSFYLSNKSDTKKIQQLLREIRQTSLNFQDRSSMKFSTAELLWSMKLRDLRKSLLENRDSCGWMEWKEYEQLASGFGISKIELKKLTEYFVQRGLLITVRHKLYYGSSFVIYDPQWLADLLSSVVSIIGGSRQRYLGVLKRSELYGIWKMRYPQQIFGQLENFLKYYEILVDFPSYSENKEEHWLFIPMSATRPLKGSSNFDKQMNEIWPSQLPAGMAEFGRSLELEYVPSGFIHRVLSRLMIIPGMKVDLEVFDRCHYFLSFINQEGNEKFYIALEQKDKTMIQIKLRVLSSEWERLSDSNKGKLFYVLFQSIEFEYLSRMYYNHKRIPFDQRIFLGDYHRTVSKRECLNYLQDPDSISLEKRELILKGALDLILSHIPEISNDQLKINSTKLAEGGLGSVYEAIFNQVTCDDEKRRVVIKFLKCPDRIQEFLHESLVMSFYGKHENLVHLRGIYRGSVSAVKHLDMWSEYRPPRDSLGMVQEFIQGGDLLKFIQVLDGLQFPDRLSEETKIKYQQHQKENEEIYKRLETGEYLVKVAFDISSGMSHFHSCEPPMIHTDLRAGNIFLLSQVDLNQRVAVVGDFGEVVFGPVCRKIFQGNFNELAPEMFDVSGLTGFTQSADVYCFGLIVWQLLSHQMPFKHSPHVPEGQLHSIVKNHLKPHMKPEWKQDEHKRILCDIVGGCLKDNPEDRFTFQEIVEKLQESGLVKISLNITSDHQWQNTGWEQKKQDFTQHRKKSFFTRA